MKKKNFKKVVVLLLVLIQLAIISSTVFGSTTKVDTIASLEGNIDTSSKAARTIIRVITTYRYCSRTYNVSYNWY